MALEKIGVYIAEFPSEMINFAPCSCETSSVHALALGIRFFQEIYIYKRYNIEIIVVEG